MFKVLKSLAIFRANNVRVVKGKNMQNKITKVDIVLILIALCLLGLASIPLYPIIMNGRLTAFPKAGSIDCSRYPMDCMQSKGVNDSR